MGWHVGWLACPSVRAHAWCECPCFHACSRRWQRSERGDAGEVARLGAELERVKRLLALSQPPAWGADEGPAADGTAEAADARVKRACGNRRQTWFPGWRKVAGDFDDEALPAAAAGGGHAAPGSRRGSIPSGGLEDEPADRAASPLPGDMTDSPPLSPATAEPELLERRGAAGDHAHMAESATQTARSPGAVDASTATDDAASPPRSEHPRCDVATATAQPALGIACVDTCDLPPAPRCDVACGLDGPAADDGVAQQLAAVRSILAEADAMPGALPLADAVGATWSGIYARTLFDLAHRMRNSPQEPKHGVRPRSSAVF